MIYIYIFFETYMIINIQVSGQLSLPLVLSTFLFRSFYLILGLEIITHDEPFRYLKYIYLNGNE